MTLGSPFDFLYLTHSNQNASQPCQDRVGSSNVQLVVWREMDKCQTAIKKKKKMTIENWSRENPEVVWKRPFQISMEPIFTTASSVSPRLLGGGPRLFGLWGHNLICSLCVNQVPQCRLVVIGAVSVESSQRFSVPGWILNTTGNTNNSTALLHSISPSVVSWTSLFKTHYFKHLY